MAELTLTGATLTSDGPLVELTSNTTGQNHAHNHSHSHAHSHSNGRPCCSSPTPIHRHPTIPDISVEEVLAWEDSRIFARLSEIVRMGEFDAFEPIVQGIKSSRGKDTVSAVLGRLGDADGASLLHWASKRGVFL